MPSAMRSGRDNRIARRYVAFRAQSLLCWMSVEALYFHGPASTMAKHARMAGSPYA